VRWYFHAVERDDGRWACQHGQTVLDSHPELEAALEHLHLWAGKMGHNAEFFVHYRDGKVQPD
jgi:hypothetical protein